MSRHRIAILAATIAILAIPATARAESAFVPPENSAAAQYTEAFPTAGGNKDVTRNNKQRPPTPSRALGRGNAEKLEAQGPLGEEAAEVAAATSPPIGPTGGGSSPSTGSGEASPGASSGRAAGHASPPGAPTAATSPQTAGEAQGSSGTGELVSAATGGSGGGALLPLTIVGAILWSAFYLLRRRRKAD